MQVTSGIKDTCSILSLSNELNGTKLFYLMTGTATKPWLSGIMLPNIKTCENRWSNFSENLRIVDLKLLELTRFLSPNLSIYSNLHSVCTVLGVRCDVDIFKLTASAQSIYREVNDNTYRINENICMRGKNRLLWFISWNVFFFVNCILCANLQLRTMFYFAIAQI